MGFKWKFNGVIGEFLRGGLTNTKVKQDVGRTAERMAKEMIAKGTSPVRGEGRFKAYAAQRLNDRPKKSLYPNSVRKKFPDKKVRPVNLKLSGDYLSEFTYRLLRKGVEIGFISPSNLTRKKFETHNLGKHKHVPQRKHLPDIQRNEQLAVSIMREIRSIVRRRISDIIKKSKG